jgi:hypothetical protein
MPEQATPVRVLVCAVETWRLATLGDYAAAGVALERLEEALALESADLRLPIAHGWADLAIAHCALAGKDEASALARLRAVVGTPSLPAGLRMAARRALAFAGMAAVRSPANTVHLLEETAALAETVARPRDAIHARVQAGIVRLLADEAAGGAYLERVLLAAPPEVPEEELLLGRLILATMSSDERALVSLAEGLRRAAAEGDYCAYVLLLVRGARLYRQRGGIVDALATLCNGVDQLEAAQPGLGAPLVAERERLRAELGEAGYAAALAEAQERIAEDRALLRRQ